MKRALTVFMLAAAAGFVPATAAYAAYDGTFPVRAASYNIRCYGAWETDSTNKWVNRSADLINLVKNIDADVIGFQEVDPEQMSELKSSLKDYEIIGKHREADDTQRATPVAYRKSRFTKIDGGTFWLSTTPNVQGSKDLGDGYVSSDPETCSWVVLKDRATGGVFSFMCTHLDWLNAELRRRNMAILLSKVDALLTPCAPTPAFRLGELQDPLTMYLNDLFTIPSSLAGVCAASVPAGFTAGTGLPVGVQFVCGSFEETKLLKICKAFEGVSK